MTGGQCVSYGCCGSKWLNWHSVLTTQCWEHQTQSRRSRDDTQLSQSAYRLHESTASRDIYTTHQTSLLSGTKYKHMHRYITCGCGSVDTPISTMRYVMYFLLLCMMSFFHIMKQMGQNQRRRVSSVQFARWRHWGKVAVNDYRLVSTCTSNIRMYDMAASISTWLTSVGHSK